VAAHALLAVALVAVARDASPRPSQAPVYRVDLVAAPPGPRQAGVVAPRPETPPPEPPAAEPPPRAETKTEMPAPPTARRERPRTPPATPTPGAPSARTPENAPRAGGGPAGGTGTDVATVRTEGIEFPFPGYLNNIVRQIAIRFGQPRCTACRAEVRFVIRRDGSLGEIRVVQRSGDFRFDLDAQGAVEAAGNARAFGPLPTGYPDDALAIVFSFDPRTLR
jgi:protein TonB